MINIFEPSIKKESELLLKQVFESNWLGRGELVTEFEEQLANYLKVSNENLHTVASCSDAIFACFKSFEILKGSTIIIPSISFPAIPSAVLEAGFNLKVIDVDVSSGNIDLDILKQEFNSDCSAVFLTDYGGIPVDIAAVREIVGSETLIFLDGAASLGTFKKDMFSGIDADFCCWSFDAMKLVTCGEGGGVYFRNKDNLEKFKEYTYLGLEPASKSGLDKASTGKPWWEYQLNRPGRRSVFTNINAALGLPNIKNIHSMIKRRNEIRELYLKAFEEIEGLSVLKQNGKNVVYSNYFFSIQTKERDNLANYLKDNNIYSTFRYFPINLIKIFSKYCKSCDQATKFSEITLNIPIHNSLTDADVSTVKSNVVNFFQDKS